jgi:hypothetical protein
MFFAVYILKCEVVKHKWKANSAWSTHFFVYYWLEKVAPTAAYNGKGKGKGKGKGTPNRPEGPERG